MSTRRITCNFCAVKINCSVLITRFLSKVGGEVILLQTKTARGNELILCMQLLSGKVKKITV